MRARILYRNITALEWILKKIFGVVDVKIDVIYDDLEDTMNLGDDDDGQDERTGTRSESGTGEDE